MSSSQPRTLLHRYTRLACRAANFSRHIYGVVYGLAYTTDHVIMGQSYRFMGRNLRTWQRSVKRLPFLVPFSISITSVGRSSFRTWADSRDKKRHASIAEIQDQKHSIQGERILSTQNIIYSARFRHHSSDTPSSPQTWK